MTLHPKTLMNSTALGYFIGPEFFVGTLKDL
jgi:hypothetical protein